MNMPTWYIDFIQPIVGFIGSPLLSIVYIHECIYIYFGIASDLFQALMLLTSVLPWLFILKFLNFNVLFLGRNDKDKWILFRNFFATAVITLQPSVVLRLVEYFRCVQLPNDPNENYYNFYDMAYQCDISTYWTFLFKLVLPNLILWVIILPLILWYFIHKNNHPKSMGAVVFGFKEELKYWSFIIMAVKIIAIFLSTFIFSSNVTTSCLTLCLIFSGYLLLIIKFDPYSQKQANETDKILTITLLITSFLTIYIIDSSSKFLSIISLIIAIGINVIVFGNLVYKIFMIKFQEMKLKRKINDISIVESNKSLLEKEISNVIEKN